MQDWNVKLDIVFLKTYLFFCDQIVRGMVVGAVGEGEEENTDGLQTEKAVCPDAYVIKEYSAWVAVRMRLWDYVIIPYLYFEVEFDDDECADGCCKAHL